MKKLSIILITCLVLLLASNITFASVRVSISGGSDITSVMAGKDITVRLPFDEEYTIKLINKDEDRRALVNIRIDGRAVTKDGLILRAGETINLERYLDAGSLSKGKKFKFVPKTEEILRPEHSEDGQIIVSVQYEKSTKPIVEYREEYSSGISTIKGWGNMVYTTNATSVSATTLDDSAGVTVEGSESTQRFQRENIGELEGRQDTLVIRLQGYYKTQPILLNK